MKEKSIRLSSFEINAIKEAFRKNFSSMDHLWLFGSRLDPNARGGDIDLYIETTLQSSQEVLNRRIIFLCDLYEKIGLQKIDVVLNLVSSEVYLPIYEIAKSEGILLL